MSDALKSLTEITDAGLEYLKKALHKLTALTEISLKIPS